MTTVLLVRHGRTPMTGRVLSGWTPDLHLDDRGREQASALAERLAGLSIAAIVSSPLERCVETITPLAERHGLNVEIDARFGEVHYGEWTGRELRALAREPLWRIVQVHPSGVAFPGGEALRDVQARAVAGVRDWNARLGAEAAYVVCSHGDPLATVLADALGMHLDSFQRISIDTAAVSIVHYDAFRPTVERLNDRCGDLSDLVRPRRARRSAWPRIRAGAAGESV
jgi:probable phosphomutase (TIGR03848 family)